MEGRWETRDCLFPMKVLSVYANANPSRLRWNALYIPSVYSPENNTVSKDRTHSHKRWGI